MNNPPKNSIKYFLISNIRVKTKNTSAFKLPKDYNKNMLKNIQGKKKKTT